jgi:hypothetical protein
MQARMEARKAPQKPALGVGHLQHPPHLLKARAVAVQEQVVLQQQQTGSQQQMQDCGLYP